MAEVVIIKNKSELERLEGIIQKNVTAFYEVGRALMEIRDSGLYSDVLGYETFEQYCQDRWDMGRDYAYKLISSSSVIDNVDNCIQKPLTESQCRPLSKLEPEQQIQAWEKVVETAPEGKITARHVSKVVNEVSNKTTQEKANNIKKKIDKIKMLPSFEEAYNNLYREVQNARLDNWQKVNREEALKLIGYIVDLINI